jgi:hypothetical protein
MVDTPVTLVTSEKPQSEVWSFKILKILKSHIAGLGLSVLTSYLLL